MDEQNAITTPVENTEQPEPKPEEQKPEAKKPDPEVEKLKTALSRANSEAAEYKRQLREKQTEAERAEAEREESDNAMREELETLRKEKRIGEHTNQALALGFDADLAARTATAMVDGDMNAVFDCLKAFVDATKTRLENEALNRQPGLSAGVPPTTNNTVDKDVEDMRRWMWGNSLPRK